MGSKTRHIEHALLLASLSEHAKFKHGAVLVKRGKVMGEGKNSYTMSAQSRYARSSVHAESNAMCHADVRGAVMYVARLASYGPAMSRPCARCESCMRNAGITKVVFTAPKGEIEQIVL